MSVSSMLNQMARHELEEFEAAGQVQQVGNLKIVVVDYPSRPGYKHVRIWRGKQSKPFYNYLLKEDRVDAEVQRSIDNDRATEEFREKRKAAQKEATAKVRDTYLVGQMLHGSWGYEQTNCELYQIVGKPAKNRVAIRPVKAETVRSTGPMAEMVRPLRDEFCGPAIVCSLGAYGVKLHEHCHLTACSDDSEHYSSWYA